LFVFINFFFLSPPINTNTGDVVVHFRSGMEGFIIACLFAVGAVYYGLLGRNVHAGEEVGENDELILQQKRMSAFSLGLFLTSDVIIIFLSSPLWH
jgi:hypothetical protein